MVRKEEDEERSKVKSGRPGLSFFVKIVIYGHKKKRQKKRKKKKEKQRIKEK